MSKLDAKFITGATDLASCPDSELPEFAFIGRSNVGKSSLINLLTGHKDLAKVSGKPGKTRQLNFFNIEGRWTVVDLPGYGHAKVGLNERADFIDAVADYLMNRPNLKGIYLLIDSRHGPAEIDIDFLTWLQTAVAPCTIILTKTDKLSPFALKQITEESKQRILAADLVPPSMLSCSAAKNKGRQEITRHIQRYLPESAKPGAKTGKSKGPKLSSSWIKKMQNID